MPDSAPFPGKPAIPSVTELTRQIRESLEGRFSDVWVEGEISNYRPHSSGHHYFTLKDARAQLSCVMFRGQARTLPEAIRDGRLVQARGDISVYEARGQYQLVVRWMQPKGFGELQARFEALKRQLEAEGLFDSGRKRPLPFFPRTVALVTSPAGAAIRDMLNILGRRAPWLRILVWPVRVQGNGASDEIARAINEIKSRPDLGIEVVIVGRGGGSIEDLWSFNEEDVARAISECPVPVISAVGHEIDFTIADFVADLRAPTPSAAAELVTPDGSELRKQIELLIRRLGLRSEQRLGAMAAHLDYHRRSLSTHEPGRVIEDYLQGCDLLKDRLEGISESAIQDRRRDLSQLGRILSMQNPTALLQRNSERLKEWQPRLHRAFQEPMSQRAGSLQNLRQVLELLSPRTAFQRGFSLTMKQDGKVVTSSDQVAKGDRIVTKLAKGEIESEVF